ncbi:MAG TPA: TlpA disulfide reductase family protein [Gaiellaceae bacterium]|jgi:cytochrome c biogenesis protein CcmG/thiol:disulfide interchange protein DsbE|nr:TlpA disulfide reductase family protein [Gaiellaceae bacterium]
MGRLKIVLQVAAVLVVALLLALLGWQVLRTDKSAALGKDVNAGKAPPAPLFTLPKLGSDGELALASLRGKTVVLNFWASWCGPCKDEAPLLESAWNRYRNKGVVVLGVDAQDFDVDAQRFVDRSGITYPIVRDKHGSTLGHYGVTGFPETWFIDVRGRLVGQHVSGPLTKETLEENIRRALGESA